MRNQREYLAAYAESHRHPTNVAIHLAGVPVIVIATLGLLWALPVGAWLGLPAPWAAWVNGATLAAVPAMLFYARLSAAAVAIMALWFAASVATILGVQALGLPLVGTMLALWVAAWAVQFVGHHVEGAKPSFVDELPFLLIGPLFVTDEVLGHPLAGREGAAA